MKVTICGSIQFEAEMKRAAKELLDLGYDIAMPSKSNFDPVSTSRSTAKHRRTLILEHFAKIDQSEAVLIVNPEKKGVPGYIGGNALMEMSYAFSQGLDIFILHDYSAQLTYADEIAGMMPTLLHGDLSSLSTYLTSLPVAHLSTNSPIKHSAVGRGFRKAGVSVRTIGTKVESGVSEQPQSVNETYEGAMNRHRKLKSIVSQQKADYYITIESGVHALHDNHNVFGLTVILIEKVGTPIKIGIDFDIEMPRSFTDKIPDTYPDIGALIKQEFGSELKDPYPFITGGQLTRTKIIEDAIYRTLVQASPAIH